MIDELKIENEYLINKMDYDFDTRKSYSNFV